MLRSVSVVARHELRIVRGDPMPLIVLVFMPVVLMAFIKPALKATLVEGGYPHANGAEQAVPGMAVLFAFFLVGFVGFSFFREHGWSTWDRLRASPAPPAAVVVGKVIPALIVVSLQLTILFVAGVVLFDLQIHGSIAALALVALTLAFALVMMGIALTAVARTVQQVNVLANLGAMVCGGLGGALVPLSSLPTWARGAAVITPTYWAMQGFHKVTLGTAGVPDVALPVVVLMLFATAFAVVAAKRLSFEETKVGWA